MIKFEEWHKMIFIIIKDYQGRFSIYSFLIIEFLYLISNILINYGIPYKIKTDNRSSFSTNRKNKEKFNITQFAQICNKLGILLSTASNAVSKANVERENGTFKNMLLTNSTTSQKPFP